MTAKTLPHLWVSPFGFVYADGSDPFYKAREQKMNKSDLYIPAEKVRELAKEFGPLELIYHLDALIDGKPPVDEKS